MEEYDLIEKFSEFGRIIDCRIRSNNTGEFAFIEFYSEKNAIKAIRNMDKVYLNGEQLRVDWAQFKNIKIRNRSFSLKRFKVSRTYSATSFSLFWKNSKLINTNLTENTNLISGDFSYIHSNIKFLKSKMFSQINTIKNKTLIFVPNFFLKVKLVSISRIIYKSYVNLDLTNRKFILIIDNLPPEMNCVDLKILAQYYGDLKSVIFTKTWIKNKKLKGLIEFTSKRRMQVIFDKLYGHKINDYKLNVKEGFSKVATISV